MLNYVTLSYVAMCYEMLYVCYLTIIIILGQCMKFLCSNCRITQINLINKKNHGKLNFILFQLSTLLIDWLLLSLDVTLVYE